MATYSAAPGITTSGSLTATGTYTVPSSSYAVVSIYCGRTIRYEGSSSGADALTENGDNTDSMTGNVGGLIQGSSYVAAGKVIQVAKGSAATIVIIDGVQVLYVNEEVDISVNYVVFG